MEQKELSVCISRGNIKMRSIPSISLPAIKTCRPNCPCAKLCYAKKITKLRRTVMASYERNLKILTEKPDVFWKTIELELMTSSVFRFFVSGDIPSEEFLAKEIEIISKYPKCQIFQFTKRYEWVNSYIEKGNKLPENLHLIFSAWKGLQMSNPFSLPECHIIYKDGTTTAHDGQIYYCSGNCTECFVENKNCFNLKKGDQILIKQH